VTFTPGEQALIDEQIRRRSEKFDRPAWMQSHRATTIRRYLREAVAALPPEPTTKRGAKVLYDAGRRVVLLHPTTRHPGQTHEADVDGLPICGMRGRFERNPDDVQELGGGPVTCGHCANARARR
jgi:hypothetical protein